MRLLANIYSRNKHKLNTKYLYCVHYRVDPFACEATQNCDESMIESLLAKHSGSGADGSDRFNVLGHLVSKIMKPTAELLDAAAKLPDAVPELAPPAPNHDLVGGGQRNLACIIRYGNFFARGGSSLIALKHEGK